MVRELRLSKTEDGKGFCGLGKEQQWSERYHNSAENPRDQWVCNKKRCLIHTDFILPIKSTDSVISKKMHNFIPFTSFRQRDQPMTQQQQQHSDGKTQLEEENKALKERKLCKLCHEKDISALYRPCLHLVACIQCGAKQGNCPICGKLIVNVVQVYF